MSQVSEYPNHALEGSRTTHVSFSGQDDFEVLVFVFDLLSWSALSELCADM